jgi:hypothetical protein
MNKSEKKTQGGLPSWFPMLAGIGIIGGGLYLWSKSSTDGGGGGGAGIPKETWEIIQWWKAEQDALDSYVDQVTNGYANALTDDQQLYVDDRQAEITYKEFMIGQQYKYILQREENERIRNLGLYWMIPGTLGLIGILYVVVKLINKLPPRRPPSDPKNPSQTFESVEAQKAFLAENYTYDYSVARIAVADTYWRQIPAISKLQFASYYNLPFLVDPNGEPFELGELDYSSLNALMESWNDAVAHGWFAAAVAALALAVTAAVLIPVVAV